MAGHPLVGLACAFVVEARHWLPGLRWDFDEPALLRAWYLTVALILFGAVTVWIDGPSSRRIYAVFTWMPVLLLPVQFVQSYGSRPTIPLYIFTLAARSRIERERELGRLVESREISFGYVTLTALLLGAALGRNASEMIFVPCTVALGAWALRGIRGERTAALPWIASVLAVSMLGFGSQFALRHFYDWLAGGVGGFGRQSASIDFRQSQIRLGGLREEKNSPGIFWRLRDIDGPPPELLRTASFNYYRAGFWMLRSRTNSATFEPFGPIVTGPDGAIYQVAGDYAVQDPAPPTLPSFNLRGRVENKSLLPMPSGLRSLRDPQADWLEYNSLGTLRIFPRHALLDTRVTWKDSRDLDSPPWSDGVIAPDLRIPPDEAPAIHATARQLGLENGSLSEKITALRAFFLRYFRYSRYIDTPDRRNRNDSGAIGRFLTGHRTGHCEYFATATTLLLRDAGVPARYAVGFAVVENDPNRHESIIRGTHAHAWCRAWDADANQWIDVDLTPPDWTSLDTRTSPAWTRRLLDRIQTMREDLLAWHYRHTAGKPLTIVVSAIVALLGAYIAGRLAKSRRPNHAATRDDRPPLPPLPAPLRHLVRAAQRSIGPRPPGLPLGPWLARLNQHLGPDPALDELIRLHAQIRFDPATPPPEATPRLATLAHSLTTKLRSR